MPNISMFYGIVIQMYCAPKEHNPPHIHAKYSGETGVFDLNTGKMIKGTIPNKKKKLIEAWIIIHQEALLADWEIAQQGELPFPIEPLK